jgi:methyl-accepting chemotaxis protein
LLTLTVAPAAQPDVGLMADTVSTPAVSVRRTHLEADRAGGKDGVHQGDRWTPWSKRLRDPGAATALLAGAAGWWLARSYTRPLKQLTRALADLKAGDIDDTRLKFRRGDEFGQMARSINGLAEQLREKAGSGGRR